MDATAEVKFDQGRRRHLLAGTKATITWIFAKGAADAEEFIEMATNKGADPSSFQGALNTALTKSNLTFEITEIKSRKIQVATTPELSKSSALTPPLVTAATAAVLMVFARFIEA